MTQGIFINGRRPKSKKEIKAQALEDASLIRIEATSFFRNDYDGPATEMPDGATVFFVGPDPSIQRTFYGRIVKKNGVVKVF